MGFDSRPFQVGQEAFEDLRHLWRKPTCADHLVTLELNGDIEREL